MRVLLLCSALLAATAAPVLGQAAPAPGRAPATLPGLQTGPAPWPAEMAHLTERLAAIGLPAMPTESFVVHIHQLLTISVRGKPVTVPANIGNNLPLFISPIHTHDTSGTIHIESATRAPFHLGQFFDVWGVRFTAQCIGGYCAKGRETLRVTSDGSPVRGDPRDLVLRDRQRIDIEFGASTPPPKAPQ